jgi:hypothetical protein
VLSLARHFIFPFLYHQKSIIAISTPVSFPSYRRILEKERTNCHGKDVHRHRRAEHERPLWCVEDHAAAKPHKIRSTSRAFDDIPDELLTTFQINMLRISSYQVCVVRVRGLCHRP